MTRLIGVRVVAGVATLVAASVLIFAVMQLLPGDAATANLQQLAAADPARSPSFGTNTGSIGRWPSATWTGPGEPFRETSEQCPRAVSRSTA